MKFVESFLKIETAELPFELVPRFMKVDVGELPAGLRTKYRARRYELDSLRKISEGKGKPPIRRAGQEPIEECEIREESDAFAGYLGMMGFFEIYPEELEFVMKRTRCTECELVEQTSYTPFYVKTKKGKKAKRKKRMFMMIKDPFEALVGQYRNTGNAKESTNFFSGGFVGACH